MKRGGSTSCADESTSMENAADGEQSCPPLVYRLHDLPSHRRRAHIPPTYDGVALMKTQGAGKDVVFLSGVRTGFGSFGGSLTDLSAIELAVVAARQAVQRSVVPRRGVGHNGCCHASQTAG